MHAHRQHHREIVALPTEDRVRLHVNRHVQVAAAPAVAAAVSPAGNPQPRAVVHTRRNQNRHGFRAHLTAVTRTNGAAFPSLAPRSAARGAVIEPPAFLTRLATMFERMSRRLQPA